MRGPVRKAELDHLFLFVPNETTARSMMDAAGLRVNYSRAHPGQGTRNLCACLDDVFLELLWLDGSEISAETERITLGARARGEGSPVGVSWRSTAVFQNDQNGTVPYTAPFLPTGITIPVAALSLDPSLPFVFQTPGGTPPIDRTDGLVGTRQAPELATMGSCNLRLPDPAAASTLMSPFENITVSKGTPALQIELLRPDGTVGRSVEWSV